MAQPWVRSGNLTDAIAWRESRGDSGAMGDAGERGLMQVMPATLSDFNRYHKTKWTMDDIKNIPSLGRRVGKWHLNVNLMGEKGWRGHLQQAGLVPNMEALVASYNRGAQGIASGAEPQAGYVEEVLANLEESKKFDPEGSDYDYMGALAGGTKPAMNPVDNKLHWGSRDPVTGRVLKGRQHPTWNLMVGEDKELGYEIIKGTDGRYHSVKVR